MRTLDTRIDPSTSSGQALSQFSDRELRRLLLLKRRYDPVREFWASNAEWSRMCWLRWRYENGKVSP